jgi:NADP-dependent 3-hydroxy acid dehydrogenase YdfG
VRRGREDTVARKLAVVTGASSGIGAATAEALGALGWTVVLVARRAARLAEVAERVRLAGGQPVVEPLDAGDAGAVAAMADRVRRDHGTPGAIVNSAGAGEWRWLEDTPPADMERMLDAPFRAAYHVTQAFVGDLLAQRGGVIVHVGSPASILPWPSATAYTVSRWALRGLHEALRQDLAGTGVHTCHVLFGEVTSEYFVANPGSHEHIPKVARLIPISTPAECAEVVVRTLHRPRPVVFHPLVLRWFHWANLWAPGPSRWVARVTGRRRGR